MIRLLMPLVILVCAGALLVVVRANQQGDESDLIPAPVSLDPVIDLEAPQGAGPATAVLAGGCFWCVEAVYQELDGVSQVESGYTGGSDEPTRYEYVALGLTDHAEAVRVTYDPSKISYGKLLRVFFTVAHDPTQLNRQGPDIGRHYRSAVFYANEDQKRVAEAYIGQLNATGMFERPIVTTLEPLGTFHLAEQHHQDYAEQNPDALYIQYEALPKVQKLRQELPELLVE